MFGSVTWLGEGRSGRDAANTRRSANTKLRVVQRTVKKKDRCRGGKCRSDYLCPKHARTVNMSGREFELYDDRGRNLNSIRPDGEQY